VVAMRSGLADVRARCSFFRRRPEYMVGLEIANTEDLCLISVGACLNFRRCLGPQRLSALGVCELWQKFWESPSDSELANAGDAVIVRGRTQTSKN
jgi:hypothetical protein